MVVQGCRESTIQVQIGMKDALKHHANCSKFLKLIAQQNDNKSYPYLLPTIYCDITLTYDDRLSKQMILIMVLNLPFETSKKIHRKTTN